MHLIDRTDRGMEWLAGAIAEQAPLTLHIKTKLGWTIAKSRFLGDSREDQRITIACPSEILGQDENARISNRTCGTGFQPVNWTGKMPVPHRVVLEFTRANNQHAPEGHRNVARDEVHRRRT